MNFVQQFKEKLRQWNEQELMIELTPRIFVIDFPSESRIQTLKSIFQKLSGDY